MTYGLLQNVAINNALSLKSVPLKAATYFPLVYLVPNIGGSNPHPPFPLQSLNSPHAPPLTDHFPFLPSSPLTLKPTRVCEVICAYGHRGKAPNPNDSSQILHCVSKNGAHTLQSITKIINASEYQLQQLPWQQLYVHNFHKVQTVNFRMFMFLQQTLSRFSICSVYVKCSK